MIPEAVQKFVKNHIHSIDALEILLLLHQEPRKEWGALAVSQALRLDRAAVHSKLRKLSTAKLVSSRFVASEEVFRYDPATANLNRTVRELEQWYSSHRVALVTLIYSKPEELHAGEDIA
jgi:hypothetical protein